MATYLRGNRPARQLKGASDDQRHGWCDPGYCVRPDFIRVHLRSSAVANFCFPQAAPVLVDTAAGRVASIKKNLRPYMAADLTDFAAFRVRRLKREQSSA
jgi:hypothetical protein